MTLGMTMELATHMHMIGIGRNPSPVNLGVRLSRENSTMISLTRGMIPGDNVCDALTRIFRLRGHDWLSVVRSIDSTCAADDLAKTLTIHRVGYDVINGNICMSMDALEQALSAGVFTGFDEVWIIAGLPPASDLSMLPSATSDGTDFSLEMPEELSRSMEQIKAVLILGDGCGLNYATTIHQLWEELIRAER